MSSNRFTRGSRYHANADFESLQEGGDYVFLYPEFNHFDNVNQEYFWGS